MDLNTILLSTGTGGTLLGILIYVYNSINHRRIRSNCCGKLLVVSVDVENTTPLPENEPAFVVRKEEIHLPPTVLVTQV